MRPARTILIMQLSNSRACFVAADQKSIDIPGYSTKGLLNAIERKMDVNGLPSSFLKEFDLSSIL